jgi:hypothetical protein
VAVAAYGSPLTLLPIATWPRLLAIALVLALAVAAVRWLLASQRHCAFTQPQVIGKLTGVSQLRPEPSQFVTRSLVILYLRDARGRRLSRVIPRDSLVGAEQHRQLRQLLLLPAPSSDRDG